MQFSALLFIVFLGACASGNTYQNINEKTGFIPRTIESHPFLLTSYERVQKKSDVATIYIEGDGRAWLSKKRPSLDPTPKNPVALKLASIDPADNVIYLARPCQYTKTVDGSPCNQKYWTSHRFAPEVMDTMNAALDDIKKRHRITGINLIGFSGGGNLAALLTAQRNDVLSLRTVAGNLDHELQSQIHDVSPMPNSLNAKDIVKRISHIPQIHFIGAQDTIIPAEIAESYAKFIKQDKKACTQLQIIPNASHTKGWEDKWLKLLEVETNCLAPIIP